MIKTTDGKEVLEDGERLVVNVMLMDAQQRALAASIIPIMHRPGFVQLTDADKAARQTMYDQADKRLNERWKNPAPVNRADTVHPARDARLDAYAHYQDRITNAWRHR